MPGEKYANFGSSSSRRNQWINFFKAPNNEVIKKFGAELINVITKDREVDASLKNRIESRK